MAAIGRRGFMKVAATAAWSAGQGMRGFAGDSAGGAEVADVPMPTRRLGKTNYDVSVCSLGGFRGPIGDEWEDSEPRGEALAIINRALDLGVNFINTAPTYGAGGSEKHFGEVLRDRRSEVFVSLQTTLKTAADVEDGFRQSCERLQTDYVDIYMFHGVSTIEDLETVLDRKTGAIRAFERLREQGRIRHIGITGHSSATHQEAIRRYDFDCVFVTMNPVGFRMNDPQNLRDMLAMAEDRDVGVLGMKILCGRDASNFLDGSMDVEKALGYALRLPVATGVIGMHTRGQVEENVRAAKSCGASTG